MLQNDVYYSKYSINPIVIDPVKARKSIQMEQLLQLYQKIFTNIFSPMRYSGQTRS